jgi:hypothetical protein
MVQACLYASRSSVISYFGYFLDKIKIKIKKYPKMVKKKKIYLSMETEIT